MSHENNFLGCPKTRKLIMCNIKNDPKKNMKNRHISLKTQWLISGKMYVQIKEGGFKGKTCIIDYRIIG